MRDNDDDYYYSRSSVVFGPTATAAVYMRYRLFVYTYIRSSWRLTISHLIRSAPPIYTYYNIPPLRTELILYFFYLYALHDGHASSLRYYILHTRIKHYIPGTRLPTAEHQP